VGVLAECSAGQKDFSTDRSKRKEQNLHQMIQVLHSRLAALEAAAQMRRKACEDDLAANSERQSIHVKFGFEEQWLCLQGDGLLILRVSGNER
jgi:hypothetical protein